MVYAFLCGQLAVVSSAFTLLTLLLDMAACFK